ncbi:MAG: transposase, partial [Oscillospiraceae bacterium]|nr:transposase [Oscillospiraceae bacterium]
CKECGRQFTQTEDKNSTKRAFALYLYVVGLSMNAIARMFDVEPSTVLYWIRNFALKIYEKPTPQGDVFVERYRKWCKRHGYNFNAAKADGIYEDARELVYTLPKNEPSKVIVQSAIEQLVAVSRTIEVLRAEMRCLAEQLPEYPVVMDIYGVGLSMGSQLMAEIGDVRRFKHRGSLTAFAGVDPMPNQSGDSERKSNPSSKRGSPYLRKTLFVVMTVLLQNSPPDDPVYQFIDKKRSEGKPYYVYMTAGANKFLRIYYGRVNEYLASPEHNSDS